MKGLTPMERRPVALPPRKNRFGSARNHPGFAPLVVTRDFDRRQHPMKSCNAIYRGALIRFGALVFDFLTMSIPALILVNTGRWSVSPQFALVVAAAVVLANAALNAVLLPWRIGRAKQRIQRWSAAIGARLVEC